MANAASKPTQPVPSRKTSEPTTTQADTVARGRHEIVRGQITEAFQEFCNDTRRHLAGIPLKERYYVFHDELRDLLKTFGKILRKACKEYTRVATAYRSELGTDLLSWVQQHLQADLAGITRDLLEHWIGQAVWVDASSNLPAWINLPLLARPGRKLSELVVELPEKAGKAVLGTIDVIEADFADVDLTAALPLADAEWVLSAIWMRVRTDLEKVFVAVIQSARVKLVALPTSKQRTPTVRRTRKTTIDQSREKQIILKILPLNLEGPKYCRAIEDLGIQTSYRMQSNGCPASYVEAYKIQKWQKPIQDEKYRLTEASRKNA